MSEKKRYQGDDRGSLFIDFLPQDVYDDLDERVKKDLEIFQRYSINRRRQEKGIEKLEKKLKPLLKDLEDRKEKLKSHKRGEKKYYNRVHHLKLKFEPIISIYEKDESSKSYKSNKYFNYKRKTYDGEPLKKRIVLYSQIKSLHNPERKTYDGEPLKKRIVLYSQIKSLHNPEFGYIQKNVYLGSQDKVRKVCGEILGEDLSNVQKRTLFIKVRKVLIPYIRTHSKNGFEEFVSENHPFHKKIVKWCLENQDVYKKMD